VLVTGPTGSGKSTTLAAMVDYVNENEYGHILTVEDPIEFVHESKRCLINQREVGTATPCPSPTRCVRRCAKTPTCILVGEMRDLETIRLALTAAETGHLVFGTLHTSRRQDHRPHRRRVPRRREGNGARSMLSESLRAVISQTCSRPRTAAAASRRTRS
jgi:twitching motility protein PilT